MPHCLIPNRLILNLPECADGDTVTKRCLEACRYFCGPYAEKTAAQAKQQKKGAPAWMRRGWVRLPPLSLSLALISSLLLSLTLSLSLSFSLFIFLSLSL